MQSKNKNSKIKIEEMGTCITEMGGDSHLVLSSYAEHGDRSCRERNRGN